MFDGGEEGDAEAVDEEGAVLAGKYALPDPEDLEELELLGEEQGQPPETVVNLVDLQDCHFLPNQRLRGLSNTKSTSKMRST